MENRKLSVRSLMQKERERRERIRRQAAALAACSVQQEQQKPQASEGAPSSVAHEGEVLVAKQPFSTSSQQDSEAASPSAAITCASVKEELPPDFFDATVGTSDGALLDEPQSHADAAVSTKRPAELAEAAVTAAQVETGVGDSRAADGEKEDVVEALEEVEEGVTFEIEEPDPSLLLPLHAQSPSDRTVVKSPNGEEGATRGHEHTGAGTACVPPWQTGAHLAFATTAVPAENISEEPTESTGRGTAESGTGSQEKARPGEPTSASSTPAREAPAVAPSSVTAALLAPTGDELRWYRPFDTVFHSELLHEEEELAELQREAQIAAEKRAAAAREAASAAAAAAVAAAAAAADETGTTKKNDALVGSSLRKRQLAKRKAAAEATAAAAAAAEAAAAAAAAAAEKRAAASEALLGTARAAKAARTAQQRENTAQEAAVPWGFFDDEEREATVRGLTGPKRLQELLRRAEERRRDMAEDLQERKDDWLRHREDVRRFVYGVEEQVQDTSAYRMRVERLKEKRRAAAADLVWTSSAGSATSTDVVTKSVATRGAAAAAVEASASQGAAPTVAAGMPGTSMTREAGKADVARTSVNDGVKRGSRVKKEAAESTSEDNCGRRRGSSGAPPDADSGRGIAPSRTGQVLHRAEPSAKKVLPGGVAGLQVDTRHEHVTGQVAAAPTVGKEALKTKEGLQQAEAEQRGSVGPYAHPREEKVSESEEDVEDFSGDEGDDSGWRAKSLLSHSAVPDS